MMPYPFSQIVDEIKDSILVVDESGHIEYMNQAFHVISGWSAKEVIGRALNEVLPGSMGWFQQALYRTKPDMQLSIQTMDGQHIPIKMNHFMEFKGVSSLKTIFMFRDVSNETQLKVALELKDADVSAQMHQQAKHFKMIHQAIIKSYADVRQACGALLRVGCQMLDMELGIISHVIGNEYKVEYTFSESLEIEVGSIFEVNNTYCAPVIFHKKPLTYNHVGADASMRGHPVYEGMRLESYIGVPLFINHDFYGTLNFTSRNRRVQDISIRDIEMTQLLAQMIERLLERDFSEKREQALMQRLQKLSIIDELTQIPNRRKFNEDINDEMYRAHRLEHPLSLMLIDIDNFKGVNDTYGHISADYVLMHFASLLQKNIRHIDRIYRYGGEEFVVLLPGANLKEAQVLATKLNTIIRENISIENQAITASIGISELKGHDNKDNFFARADRALYDAKHSGKDCYRTG